MRMLPGVSSTPSTTIRHFSMRSKQTSKPSRRKSAKTNWQGSKNTTFLHTYPGSHEQQDIPDQSEVHPDNGWVRPTLKKLAHVTPCRPLGVSSPGWELSRIEFYRPSVKGSTPGFLLDSGAYSRTLEIRPVSSKLPKPIRPIPKVLSMARMIGLSMSLT